MAYINGKKILQVVRTTVVPATYQEKTISPNNFQREVTPDVGYAALSKVKINGILIDPHTEIESQTDTDIKYQKTVPAGALRYAGLNKVGGMSYKFNQLRTNETINGSGNSTLGWAKIGTSICSLNYGHKYYVSFDAKYASDNEYSGNSCFKLGNDSYSDYVISTADMTTTFKHYSKIDTLVLNNTPANQAFFQKLTSNSDKFSIEWQNVQIVDLTDIYGAGNEPTTVAEFKATFNKDYYAYTENTLHHSLVTSIESNEDYEIPSEVQALSGYGMGINSSLYNYINFESKKFIQKVGIVDLGTLNWSSAGTSVFTVSFVQSQVQTTNILVSNCYIPVTSWGALSGTDKSIYISDNHQLYVNDSAYTDATTFKQAMSGVYLLYELETPVETDIREYITQDTLDLGDYITFNNEYQQAVPSSITYLVEV